MGAKGTLYIISAPSGAGKTTLVNKALECLSDMVVSISYTTRPIRKGEQQGVNYSFVSVDEFQNMLTQEAFLEYAVVFGHFYGTSRQWVLEKLQAGLDVVLEIDWQGAQQIRKLIPESISIFILPPSRTLLLDRLRARGQDDTAVIQQRMAEASTEISHYHEYDYLVVNDDFHSALTDLCAIVKARRLLQAPQAIKHADLLSKLLTS